MMSVLRLHIPSFKISTFDLDLQLLLPSHPDVREIKHPDLTGNGQDLPVDRAAEL